jgi:hypothetical protein
MTIDALESNSGRFFGVVNVSPLLPSLYGDARARAVVLENKKGDSSSAIP